MKYSVSLWALCASFAPLASTDLAAGAPTTVGYVNNAITQAIRDFEATQLSQWAFQVARYENEEGDETSSIERFNPQHKHTPPWQLLSINKRAPTDEEKTAFQQRKQDANVNISLRLSELIQTNSLALIAEDGEYIRASFNVYLEQLGESASKHLKGSLRFAKQEAFIEHIEITNTDSFSPMFAATIDSLTLNLTFFKIDQVVLTRSIDLKMQGSFALFTDIDEVSSDVYSNYQFIGPQTPID